jgi:hypothetical protein
MLSAESVPFNLLLCGAAFNPNEEKLFTGSFARQRRAESGGFLERLCFISQFRRGLQGVPNA